MADHSTLATQARSWADLIATFVVHDGESIEDVDISSLSVSAERSRGVQRKHGRKYARTRGSTEYSASVQLYDSGWLAVRPALLAAATAKGVDLYDVMFDIIAKRKPVDSTVVETIKIEDCLIQKQSFDFAEGDDPDQVPMDLDVGNVVVLENGTEVNLG